METRELCKSYQTGTKGRARALDGISLTIRPGSFTALTGPSGSGKTTLLAMLGALDRPTSGQILFQGRNLADVSEVELARVRRRMGFIFQDCSLIQQRSVGENITYHLIPRGVRRRERRQIAQSLLEQLGMSEKASLLPRELSGGERQRVALARALAGRPEVILADEPISNLDPQNGQAVLELLRERFDAGTTIIMATHDSGALSHATTVHELSAGKLLR